MDSHLHDRVYYEIGADLALVELGENTEETEQQGLPGQDQIQTAAASSDAEEPRWLFLPVTDHLQLPGVEAAARVGNYKALFNLRGDNGQATGGLAVDSNLGWKGPDKYVATIPQIFDLWQDPQERYDLFMTNWTEIGRRVNTHGQNVRRAFIRWGWV